MILGLIELYKYEKSELYKGVIRVSILLILHV